MKENQSLKDKFQVCQIVNFRSFLEEENVEEERNLYGKYLYCGQEGEIFREEG